MIVDLWKEEYPITDETLVAPALKPGQIGICSHLLTTTTRILTQNGAAILLIMEKMRFLLQYLRTRCWYIAFVKLSLPITDKTLVAPALKPGQIGIGSHLLTTTAARLLTQHGAAVLLIMKKNCYLSTGIYAWILISYHRWDTCGACSQTRADWDRFAPAYHYYCQTLDSTRCFRTPDHEERNALLVPVFTHRILLYWDRTSSQTRSQILGTDRYCLATVSTVSFFFSTNTTKCLCWFFVFFLRNIFCGVLEDGKCTGICG
jgi:hypothetical protein